jgi:hypothetical protein
MPGVHPLMMGSSIVLPAFVASGLATNGTPIDVAAAGATTGDLIMVCVPYNNSTLGGTWNDTLYTTDWGYPGRFSWKLLADVTSIAFTNTAGGQPNGFWAIYRAMTSAAVVVQHSDVTDPYLQNGLNYAIPTFPAPAATCVAQVVFGYQQYGTTNLTAPSGWTDRGHFFDYSVGFSMDVLDTFMPIAASPQFNGRATTYSHHIVGVELRV